MQPITRTALAAPRSFSSAAPSTVSIDSAFALSMKAQVLTTTASARSGSSTTSNPDADSSPAVCWESTSLRPQPSVTIATLRTSTRSVIAIACLTCSPHPRCRCRDREYPSTRSRRARASAQARVGGAGHAAVRRGGARILAGLRTGGEGVAVDAPGVVGDAHRLAVHRELHHRWSAQHQLERVVGLEGPLLRGTRDTLEGDLAVGRHPGTGTAEVAQHHSHTAGASLGGGRRRLDRRAGG